MPELIANVRMDAAAPAVTLAPLMAAIAVLYRATVTQPFAPMLQDAAAALADADAAVATYPEGKQLSVCRNLAAALAHGRSGPLQDVAAAIAAVAPHGDWLQNPNYVARPPSADFLETYGYLEWVGPGRAIESQTFRIGVLMLAPHTVYPAHRHPAEEVYHVIAGAAFWSRDTQPWRSELPGAAIHHPPNVAHATKTASEPLLALYCWSGAIGTAAQLAPPSSIA